MRARVVGGMLDGQTIDAAGIHAAHPFMDKEYSRAYGEWFARYGIAEAWALAGHDDSDYEMLASLPPKPKMPLEIYEWARADDGSYELRFDRIER